MTGGSRIRGSVGRSTVKTRRGVVASRLEAPLRAIPHDHRRPTLWRRLLFALEYLGSLRDEALARRRIRAAQREIDRGGR